LAASSRIADARLLAQRTAMTGEKLDPLLPHTAAGVSDGTIGGEHVRIIRRFFAHLPAVVDVGTREAAERDLAGIAAEFAPEQLATAADRLMTLLDQDGDFSDGDRARKRGLTLGRQGYDGMSTLSGVVDPELRATLEALFAKLAAPGVGNPDAESPGLRAARPRRRSALICAARPSGATTHSKPADGRCWRRGNSGSTMASRRPSSSPPPCRTWNPRAVTRSPAAAPCCP